MTVFEPDRRLAKRLTREARLAAQASAHAHAKQVRAARRVERARLRARRALPWQGGTVVASTALVVAGAGPDQALGVVGLLALVAGVRSVAALLRPPPQAVPALPPTPPVAPPPDPRSAAWPAVRRLEGVRYELVRLIPLVAPVGRAVADEAWRAAGEADAALRWQAARLAAVEPHRGAEPELMRPLYAGVQAQERLVVAVADLVAASADPMATRRLQDATDALHGLAQGLREVR
ncbi:MAG: hypothetical protein AVDCRST_MAG07-3534 [uncultured Frankineae bacterium]|uniref:Uncharacterized protein n=1 Tax=uncultured Frankineae bacterium TaxID=437475 RepID=A0A6J4MCU1_9ACTN|nr:MAG: hypothetical protein AVDCRST_MAG07-3534 [uncultured Frankineae bacterium]